MSGIHLCLHSLPHPPGGGDEGGSELTHLVGEAPLWTEVTLSHSAKDLINRGVGGQRAVKDGELPLQTLRDVVPPAARVNHGCHQLVKVIAHIIRSQSRRSDNSRDHL